MKQVMMTSTTTKQVFNGSLIALRDTLQLARNGDWYVNPPVYLQIYHPDDSRPIFQPRTYAEFVQQVPVSDRMQDDYDDTADAFLAGTGRV
jgi:hypothetical protein